MKITHATQSLHELISLREDILLNPSWQRGPVWSKHTKALLIDSILRGYDIPMIYLLKRPAAAPHQYEVVDGQQRLRAIWEFIDGDYSLSPDLPNVDRVSIANKEYHDLPKRLRKKIEEFEIVVAYIKNARQPQVSEVFSRMQMGVRLNPAELRNAIQSGLRQAIDGIAREHPFFKNSRISSSRFKRQDFLAHAISVAHHRATRDAKASQLKDDYIHIVDIDVYAPLMAAADDILSIMNRINLRCSKRIRQKWMFVDLFYLLYQYRPSLDSISEDDLLHFYLELDDARLEYNAEPERLLQGTPKASDEDLYAYIVAFKFSGGEKANIQLRAEVISKRFNRRKRL